MEHEHRSRRVEDAPDRSVAFLCAVHERCGAGDGRVTPRMVQRFLSSLENRAQTEAALGLSALSADAAWDALWSARLPQAPPAPPTPPRERAVTHEATPDPLPLPLRNDTTDDDQSAGTAAPGRLDGAGRVLAMRSERPLAPGSAALADALEPMALALESGAGWPAGTRSARGRRHLLNAAAQAVEDALGADRAGPQAVGVAWRLRVAGAAVAGVLARRAEPDVAADAAEVLRKWFLREPRKALRAAWVSHVLGWDDAPAALRATAESALPALMPARPPPLPPEALRVRHVVYAPEYRELRDAYQALGFVRLSERPLVLAKDVQGGLPLRVSLRRAPAALVLAPDAEDAARTDVLLLTGVAGVLPVTHDPPGSPRVVVAALRRDPFGVPRMHERFASDQLVGVARGDRPLEDAAFVDALLTGLALGLGWAEVRARCLLRAPSMSARTLWPHLPGAVRAAGGLPAPFAQDPQGFAPHPLTHALMRPSRRAVDLRWRNDAPDATSHLAMEVAAGMACAPLDQEDVPLLEAGGFHEGLPDVEVQTGAALWRVSLTRGLCSQAEEALAGLLTLHTTAQRAQLLLDPPRLALLRGGCRAARILELMCATRELAEDVLRALVAHAGLPGALTLDALLAASRDDTAFTALAVDHARWLAD